MGALPRSVQGMRTPLLAALLVAIAGAAVLTAAGCGSSNYVGLECSRICQVSERAGGARGGTEVVYTSEPAWWSSAPECEGNIVPIGSRYCRKS